MNPYDVLGVPSDATPDDIRAAYRRAAKRHHPDAGGDPEAFAELGRAHDILMSPQARLTYDTTGKAEAPKPDDIVQHAYDAIFAIVHGVLDGSPDPATVPIMDLVRQGLEEHRRKIEATREEVRASLRRAESTAKRFRKRSPGNNIIQRMVEDRVRMLQIKIDEAQPHLDRLAKALEIAADYEFDRVVPQAAPPGAYPLSQTAGVGIMFGHRI